MSSQTYVCQTDEVLTLLLLLSCRIRIASECFFGFNQYSRGFSSYRMFKGDIGSMMYLDLVVDCWVGHIGLTGTCGFLSIFFSSEDRPTVSCTALYRKDWGQGGLNLTPFAVGNEPEVSLAKTVSDISLISSNLRWMDSTINLACGLLSLVLCRLTPVNEDLRIPRSYDSNVCALVVCLGDEDEIVVECDDRLR
ncbi:hypothetical protein Tco_1464949 [Tanacetum coccineum]